MTDNFKMCLELTEELEKHKKRINQYKQQLKAKEQECEELKAKCKKYGEINEQETKDYAELKAENDELKEELEELKEENEYNEANAIEFKQTLTEIKEICNNNDELKGDFNLVDCDKYKLGKHNLANRILQKISEVEDESNI